MHITIVGTGYVGLVAGACFAESGNRVTCVDNDHGKVATLSGGGMPLFEPGLEEIVRRNLQVGRLRFTTALPDAVREADVIFIAVATPRREDGSADLRHVLDVARDVGHAMNAYKVIVTKSTVPVGTAARVKEVVAEQTHQPFSVVSNPEFLKQGAAVDDFMKPDRVVIGAEDQPAIDLMLDLYAPFTRTGVAMMVMDCASAEMTKYVANAMLASRISFMNEVANVCELVGADVDWVRRAVGADRRIGAAFLFPGIGYGGSCFPKDVRAMIHFAAEQQYEFRILNAVEDVNRRQKTRLFTKIQAYFGDLAGVTVAVWGLAFKPRTDDMREAPAIALIEALLEAGATVQAYDPQATATARRVFGTRIAYASRSYDALLGVDCLAIVTEWDEFRNPDFDQMHALMRNRVVFDGRNVFTREQMRAAGFVYHSLGRGRDLAARQPALAAVTLPPAN